MNKNLNKRYKKVNLNKELWDDTTKYGEFVCSYFAWISLKEQKKRTKELEDMTKNK